LFTDDVLYQEILSKATFWLQQNFYGVDLTVLHSDSLQQYFAQVLSKTFLCKKYVLQVVVDAFDPSILVSNTVERGMNFSTVAEQELYDFTIPLEFKTGKTPFCSFLRSFFFQ